MLNSNRPLLPSTFVKPNYGNGCFSDIPLLTHSLLAATPERVQHLDSSLNFREQYDFVMLFFLDGFGWRFFEKFADHPFLQRFSHNGPNATATTTSSAMDIASELHQEHQHDGRNGSGYRNGQVAKWTSQFPSTTAAHVTAIHTGLSVGQSGLYEWFYYEPAVDAVIAPLLFSHAGMSGRDTLFEAGIDPATIYPSQMTHYERLQGDNISSTILQHAEYTPSTYSDVVFRGAEVLPYRTLPEALTNLRLHLAEARSPHYYFLYFDKIDSLSHEYGPNAAQVDAEIDTALTALERLFVEKVESVSAVGRKGKRGLMMVTADHGMAEVDPATTIYLNTEPRFESILPTLKKDRKGQPIVPAGAPRDMFLYVEESRLEEVHQHLAAELEGVAVVVKTADLLDQGYFGPGPLAPQLHQRLGNLVILSHLHQTVWWYEDGKHEMDKFGHHGGLTPEEAYIPLLTLELEL